jgi:hypothetical protein
MKTIIAGLVAIGAAIAIVIKIYDANESAITPATASAPPAPAQPSSKALPPENAVAKAIPVQAATEAEPQAAPKSIVQTQATQGEQPLVINGYQVQDPLARIALSSVGADPDANAYWTSAINDPTLPSEERKDLIEDLNEDGLSDPHNPGPQDMPLIAARIQLIESLAPYAMDQVDANAFAEAEKDLVGMRNGQAPQ